MADEPTAGGLPGIDAVPPELLKGDDTQGGESPSTLSRVLDDIGTGIVETPGAIARGAAGAVAETGQSIREGFEAVGSIPKVGGALKAGLTGVLPGAELGAKAAEKIGEGVKSFIGDRQSVTGNIVENVSQFVTAFIGAGKFMKVGGVGGGLVKGAVADAFAFDPGQERLSNLIEQFPTLSNPISEMLAAEKDDSAAVGRLKNAAEGLLLGGMLDGLIATVRGWRAKTRGDFKEAEKQSDIAEQSLKQDEAPAPKADVQEEAPKVEAGDAEIKPPQGEQAAADVVGPQDDNLRSLMEQAGEWGDPMKVAQRMADDPEALHASLDAFEESVRLAENEIAKRYGVKRSELWKLEDHPLSKTENDFVFYGDTPASTEQLKALREALSPVDSLDEAAQELAYAFRKLPDDIGNMSDLDKLAVSRVQVLFNEVSRLGGDIGAVLENAANKYGAKFSDPEDALDMLASVTERMKALSENKAPALEAPKAPALEPPKADAQAAGIEQPKLDGPTVEPAPKVEVSTPGVQPKVRTTEEEVSDLISTLTKDAEALDQYGSREAAEAAGHKFAPRSSHFLPQGSTPEDILTAIDAAADKKAADFAKLRGGNEQGVQSWKDVQADAKDIAEMGGTTPEVFLQTLNRQAAEADQMASQIVYRRALYRGVADQVMQLAKQRAYGASGKFASMDELDAELARMIGFMADFSAKSGAVESNIARALNAMKGNKLFDPKAIFGENADMGQVAANIMAAGDDWVSVAKTARRLTGPRPGDKLLSFAMANMLSGPETHIINMAGNLSHAAMIPSSKIAGGLSDGLFATLRGDLDGAAEGIRYAKEGYQQIVAMASLWRSSLKLARDAFWYNRAIADPLATKLTDVKGAEVGGTGAGGKVDPIGGLMGAVGDRLMMVRENPVRGTLENMWDLQQSPLRLLQAEDEFFKQLVSRSNIVARAQVEGTEAGLKGQDLKVFVSKKLEDAFDANTGMLKDPEALLEAREATFTDKLTPGGFAVKAQGLINHNVVSRLLIAPFFSTLTNIIGAGVRYTPGANYALLGKYREAIKAGGDTRRKAIGQAYVGAAFWGLAINEALEGRITGPGPSNQQQRMALEGTGWRPYSYMVARDDGTRSYIPLNVFDPLGMIFTMAAEATGIAKSAGHGQYESIGEAGVASGLAVARVLENRSMFGNLSGIFDLMSKRDEASLTKVLSSQARMMIPGASAMNMANRYDDPDMRQAQTMWERIKRGIPGLSDDMAVRANFIGEPVEKQARLMTTQKGDVVTRELVRAIQIEGQAFQAPSPYLTERGLKVDLRQVELKDGSNAFNKYMEFVQQPSPNGKSLRDEMSALIKSKSYKDAKDGSSREPGSKLYRLSALRGRYQKQASARLKREFPEVRTALVDSKAKNDRLRQVRDSLLSEGDMQYLHGDEREDHGEHAAGDQ